MFDILLAAHIVQLETRLRNAGDWHHDPVRISRFRLAVLAFVFGAMTAVMLASTYPDRPAPGMGDKFVASVGPATAVGTIGSTWDGCASSC